MNARERDKLINELNQLLQELQRKQLEMFEKLMEHIEYHHKEEANWGLVKRMKDHPFKTLLLGMLMGALLFKAFNLEKILSLIVGKFF